VTALAEGQHGLIASGQLQALGCSRSAVAAALRAGRLQRHRRGVYLIAGTPPSPFREVLAACLAAGPESVASHLSAAWLWDFDRVRSDHVDVTTLLRPTRRLVGVRTHTTGTLIATDIGKRHDVPVTSPGRSAVDLAGVLSPYLLARFVDHLRRRGHLSTDQLAHDLELLGGRGRPGTRNLRRIVAERQEGLEPGDNDAEVELVRRLVQLGVRPPEQQVQVVVGRRVFVLDVAWSPWRVALELDGFDPHATDRTTFDGDKERDILLRQVGWEVVHVTTKTDLRLVAGYLVERLAAPPPPPPPPSGSLLCTS
jgi:very-short-patch-repair endonuclease